MKTPYEKHHKLATGAAAALPNPYQKYPAYEPIYSSGFNFVEQQAQQPAQNFYQLPSRTPIQPMIYAQQQQQPAYNAVYLQPIIAKRFFILILIV